MNEEWKVVAGCPHYEVSTLGNIRTKRKVVKTSNGHKREYPSHPVTIDTRDTHPIVGIVDKTGKVHITTVKRLVAKAFIRNPHRYERIYCIDGNEENCQVENLEWVSCDEYYRRYREKKLIEK